MESTSKKLEDNPKEALEAYLKYMWTGYNKWYEKAVRDNQRLWLFTQSVAILAGFGTAVLAALSNETWFQNAVWRVILTILPLIGTLAGTISATSKVAAKWALREQGRQAIQQLVDSGRQQFAAATTPAEYSAIHASLVKNVSAIEASQAEGCFPLISDITPKSS